MAELKDLNVVDANNTGAAANAGFPEGMDYRDVNNAARALEGMLARWYSDISGSLTTGGSASAYTLTPNRTVTAYTAGDSYMAQLNHTSTGASTLDVSGLGPKAILLPDGSAVQAGDLVSGSVVLFVYDGTQFRVVGAAVAGNILNKANTWTKQQTLAPVTITDPANWTATDSGIFYFQPVQLTEVIEAPSGAADGMVIHIIIEQPTPGGKVVTFGQSPTPQFSFPGGLAQNPVGTQDGEVTLVSMLYSATVGRWLVTVARDMKA